MHIKMLFPLCFFYEQLLTTKSGFWKSPFTFLLNLLDRNEKTFQGRCFFVELTTSNVSTISSLCIKNICIVILSRDR